jgi:hypothetical protein
MPESSHLFHVAFTSTHAAAIAFVGLGNWRRSITWSTKP